MAAGPATGAVSMATAHEMARAIAIHVMAHAMTRTHPVNVPVIHRVMVDVAAIDWVAIDRVAIHWVAIDWVAID